MLDFRGVNFSGLVSGSVDPIDPITWKILEHAMAPPRDAIKTRDRFTWKKKGTKMVQLRG